MCPHTSSYWYICVLILEGWQVQNESRQGAAQGHARGVRPGTQFTGFTGTKVQILTASGVRAAGQGASAAGGGELSLLALLVQKYTY